jgi:hypothetical protein
MLHCTYLSEYLPDFDNPSESFLYAVVHIALYVPQRVFRIVIRIRCSDDRIKKIKYYGFEHLLVKGIEYISTRMSIKNK